MPIKVKLSGVDAEFKRVEKEQLKEMQKQLLAKTFLMKADLKAQTPVDTGKARDGWTIIPTPANAVYVDNNVPYIEALNNGHSQQAPSHFVERTALRYGKPIGTIVTVK